MRPENAIAANCRRLRTAKGLSQVDLAEKVGLSRPGYLKVESGESIPRSDTLERIARRSTSPLLGSLSTGGPA